MSCTSLCACVCVCCCLSEEKTRGKNKTISNLRNCNLAKITQAASQAATKIKVRGAGEQAVGYLSA